MIQITSSLLPVLPLLCVLITACGGGGGGGGGGGSHCSASNCIGCCFNDVCQSGITSAGCGSGGLACSVCESYQICLPEQRCGLDPNQQWLLAAGSATITPTNNGVPWDADGSPPDPYVTFDGQAIPYIQDTYTPVWNKGFVYSASALQTTGVVVQVWDKDLISDDTVTPPARLKVTEPDFASGQITIRNWGGIEQIIFLLQQR